MNRFLELLPLPTRYPAQAGASLHPWDYTMRDPADPQAQERCFRAFQAAWESVPELRGVAIWIWMHGQSGSRDSSYAIAGKPAEAVVREFFEWRRTGDTPQPPTR